MKATIYLLRHGEPEQRFKNGMRIKHAQDSILSDIGREEITNTAQKLQRENVVFDALYSSPYRRATDSAVLLQNILHTSPFIIDDRLKDLELPPELDGLTSQEIRERRSNDPAYGYLDTKIEKDTLDFWNDLLASVNQREGEGELHIGVVTHLTPIVTLLYRLDHPEGPLPKFQDLSESDYAVKRSGYWKLHVENEHVIEREKISILGEGSMHKEKES